jgi:hypothetical protein
VVQVEPRVAVRGHEVAARVATNRKVSCGMYAHEVVDESRHTALHVRPEAVDALAFEQRNYLRVVGPLAGGPRRNVTLEAARVVAETQEWCLLWVGEVAVRVWGRTGQSAEYWTQVHAEVFEGPIFETAAAFTVRDQDAGVHVGCRSLPALCILARRCRSCWCHSHREQVMKQDHSPISANCSRVDSHHSHTRS